MKIQNTITTLVFGHYNDLWERLQYIYAILGSKLFVFDITFYSSKAIWFNQELLNCGYMTSMNEYQSMPFGGLIDKCSEDHYNYIPIISMRILFYLIYDHRQSKQYSKTNEWRKIFILVDNSRINKNICEKVVKYLKEYINYKKIHGERIYNVWTGKDIDIDDYDFKLLQCWLHMAIRARNGGLFRNKKHEGLTYICFCVLYLSFLMTFNLIGVSFARNDIIHLYQRVSALKPDNITFDPLDSEELNKQFPKLNNSKTHPFKLYKEYPWLFTNTEFNQHFRTFINTLYQIIGCRSINKILDLLKTRRIFEFQKFRSFLYTILSLVQPQFWDSLLSFWTRNITLHQWSNDNLNQITEEISIPSYIATASQIHYLIEGLKLNTIFKHKKHYYFNIKHLRDTIKV